MIVLYMGEDGRVIARRRTGCAPSMLMASHMASLWLPAEGIYSSVWPGCQGVSGAGRKQNPRHGEAIIVLLGMLECNKLDADLQKARREDQGSY